MNSLLIYLWEASVCLLLLYAFYRIFLAKLTFFSWNRVYLMLSVAVVLTIPLLSFEINSSPEMNPSTGSLLHFLPEHEILPSAEYIPSMTIPVWVQLINWIYFGGLMWSLLRLFTGLHHIIRQTTSTERHVHQGTTVLVHPDFKPASFFNYVFLPEYLPEDKDQRLIIKHEQIHARFFHTVDCLIFQLFRCFFWFHPIIKLMENSLHEVHEYQVDREITRSHSKVEYSHLLVNLIWPGGGKLVNNFNQFQIKNRIMMMAKQKSKSEEKFRFLLALPLMGLLIVLFSCEYQETDLVASSPTTGVFDVVDNMPKPDGGLEGWNHYLANNLVYPKEAKEKGISGTVYVTFTVNTEGSIQDVEIFKGIRSDLDKEAIKAVENAPKWQAGTQNGRKVNVKMRLPIRFGIEKSHLANDNSPIRGLSAEEANAVNGELQVEAKYNNGIWSGSIRDPKGNALPGATVVLAETTTGTVSDINGRFSLKADGSGELYASFKGYKSVRL